MNPLGLQPERFTVAVAGAPEGGERVVGIVQVAPLGEGSTGGNAPSPASVELRSLVVARRHRRRGLGARLVRHRLAQLPPGTQVWLTTVERQEAFYNKLGFERQPLIAAPGAMRFEVAAGLLVARLVAKQQLLLMRGTVPGP